MRILLLKDITGLGKAAEVKAVSDGYARNFLIPKGLAVIATKALVEKVGKERHERIEKLTRDHEKNLKLKNQIESKIFTIKAKANKVSLFAAVHEEEIIKAINDKIGFDLDKKQISIPIPIKSLGQAVAQVNLDPEVKAVVNISIEAL